jgi:carbonic anhydrase
MMSSHDANDGSDAFQDVLQANWEFQWHYDGSPASLPLRAGRGLAVVMCADARIEPLESLGLSLGDALILRNMGGQVTDEVLTALILGIHQLGVDRILISQHTHCALTIVDPDTVRSNIAARTGQDASSVHIPVIKHPWERLAEDVARVREHALIPREVIVLGALFDLQSGYYLTSPEAGDDKT